MRTFNPTKQGAFIDKRTDKVSAIKAVLRGQQPVSSLKRYYKRPEWNICFWLEISNGTYRCIEFGPSWNWDEDETAFEDGNIVNVTLERFRQLEQIWQKTANIDRSDIYPDDATQMPSYESIMAMIVNKEDEVLTYWMDIPSEVYLSDFKHFRDSVETNPFIVDSSRQ